MIKKTIFRNYGGSYQLNIEKPEDLKNVLELDEALWAATSIPVSILNTDRKFLSYLDADGNGRIRTDEIKAAVRWLFNTLKDYSHISEKTDALLLKDLNENFPSGRIIKITSETILSNLNAPDTDIITLSNVRNIQGIMANSATNGDGIITPEDTEAPILSALIKDIMKTVGSSTDASGKEGVSGGQIKEFFDEAALLIEWKKKGQIPEGEERTDIMIWGEKSTPEAFSILAAIEGKLDEFFLLCNMQKIDGRVKEFSKMPAKELEEIDYNDRDVLVSKLEKSPVSEVNDKFELNLEGNINRVYDYKLQRFRKMVLEKWTGKEEKTLTQDAWEEIKEAFRPYRVYLSGKKGGRLESLTEEKLAEYLGGDFREQLENLVRKDLEAAEKIRHIQDVEKLILFQKHLLEFANNSASFSDVYNPDVRSLFEAGTLVIDGRKITLTIMTSDRAAHKKIAQNSNVYLLYLEITSKNTGENRFEAVAAVTSGDSGRLRIGKRGIFFTRDNREWDAEVIDIAVNPIGLLESIKAPFIKISDAIKTQVEKFAKTREAKVETTMIAPSNASMTRDLLVGGGVAIAALGSSFAYITKALSQVRLSHIGTTILLIIMALLLPGLIMGVMKLRRRDLSILFEASGCAINVRMKLTVNLGRIFTFVPPFPPGSCRKKPDILPEFAQKIRTPGRSCFKRILITALITTIVFTGIFLLLLFFRLSRI